MGTAPFFDFFLTLLETVLISSYRRTTDMTQAGTGKKPGNKPKSRTPPRIDRDYLYYAGIKYLERYTASREQFRDVLYRKIMRSCRYHTDQDEAACRAQADELVEEFTNAGYLDDNRYTQAMVASYRRKGESRNKIRQRLMSKGVEPDLIAAALERYDDVLAENAESDEDTKSDSAELCAALRYVQRKRLGPFATRSQATVEQRHYGRLARAGFSYRIANQALNMEEDEARDWLQAFD